MVSVNYTNLNLLGYSSLPSSRLGNENANNLTNNDVCNNAKPNTFEDKIDFSDDAKAYMSATQYAKFMPVREGFSANNIALGVSDPSAEPFSQKRALADVANAARENLNQKYELMKQSGKPYDYNSLEGKDWYSAFGDLDRRALFAIRSNQGGQFTKQEQEIAQSIMSSQEGIAMGLYSGPSRLAGDFADKFAGNDVARFKAYQSYLSRVSDDEKASGDWILANDSAKRGYQSIIENEKYRREHKEEKGLTLLDVITQISKEIQAQLDENAQEDLKSPEIEKEASL